MRDPFAGLDAKIEIVRKPWDSFEISWWKLHRKIEFVISFGTGLGKIQRSETTSLSP